MRRFFLAGLLVLLPSLARADVLVVTSIANSGPGSLRQAIADASSGDVIRFASALNGQTIVLASALILSRNVSILGPGPDQLTISGNDASRIFSVGGFTTATVAHLRLTAGFTSSLSGGGAVLNQGDLTLENCRIDNSEAVNGGGGVYSLNGTLRLNGSVVENNTTDGAGGGVYVFSRLSMFSSTVRDNASMSHGGGVYLAGRSTSNSLSISQSTISGNTAGGDGGGIYRPTSSSFRPTLLNSTVSGNTATGNGGGLYTQTALEVTSNTIADNAATAGGGVYRESGNVRLASNLIGTNTASSAPDLSGTFISDGYNVVGTTAGSAGVTNGVNDDLVTASLGLLPLADNGGPTLTHGLASTSPAVDAGYCTLISKQIPAYLSVDQRGLAGGAFARPVDQPGVADVIDGCDAGAFELGATARYEADLAGFIFLEGPYIDDVEFPSNANAHATTGRLPMNQPFNAAPWSYAGTETWGGETAKSDWMLLELRETPDGPAVHRVAGMVGQFGSYFAGTGTGWPVVTGLSRTSQSYYLALRFRNHRDVVSPYPISLDFSDRAFSWEGFYQSGDVYDPASIVDAGTFFAARAGDLDADDLVTAQDALNVWRTQLGLSAGYFAADLDFDGDVDTADLLLLWLPNNGW